MRAVKTAQPANRFRFTLLRERGPNRVRTLGLLAALTLSGCSDFSSPSPGKTTAQFLRAFSKTGSDYRAIAIEPLRIEFSSPDGSFRYRYSLAPTSEFFVKSSIKSKSRSEVILRQARQAALTLPFVEKTNPTFSDPDQVSALFAKVHEAVRSCETIEFEGELRYDDLSTDGGGGLKNGSTRYRTRSQFRHGDWTRFDYFPLIQTYESRPPFRVETGMVSFVDGVVVEAVERSGSSTDLDELDPVYKATIRKKDSPFTNLNWDNGRTPFLAYYEILGYQGGSDFFSPENAAQRADLNILIEPHGEHVRITILGDFLGNGFAKTILELAPAKNYALVSARTEIDVDESAVAAIESVIEARDFRLAEEGGTQLYYPSKHRFELRSKGGFEVKGEHEIRAMRLLRDQQRSDFEIALDESWKIDDQRKEIAAEQARLTKH